MTSAVVGASRCRRRRRAGRRRSPSCGPEDAEGQGDRRLGGVAAPLVVGSGAGSAPSRRAARGSSTSAQRRAVAASAGARREPLPPTPGRHRCVLVARLTCTRHSRPSAACRPAPPWRRYGRRPPYRSRRASSLGACRHQRRRRRCESATDAGRLAPGIGDHVLAAAPAARPGRPAAALDAVGAARPRANAACSSPSPAAPLIPPSGLHGRNASAAGARTARARPRCCGTPAEYWFCDAHQRRAEHLAAPAAIWSTSAFERPTRRTSPASYSSLEGAHASRRTAPPGRAGGAGSRSMASTPRRRSEPRDGLVDPRRARPSIGQSAPSRADAALGGDQHLARRGRAGPAPRSPRCGPRPPSRGMAVGAVRSRRCRSA